MRFFGPAGDAAGTGTVDDVPGATVGAVLSAATDRFGPELAAVVANSRIWLNGEPADPGQVVSPTDEVAVLPPVSGG